MVGGLGWIFAGTRLHVSGGSHVCCLIKMKWGMFVEDLPNIIPIMFVSDWHSGLRRFLWYIGQLETWMTVVAMIFCLIKTKWRIFVEIILSIKVWFKLAKQFQRRWLKCKKFTDDGWMDNKCKRWQKLTRSFWVEWVKNQQFDVSN